MQFPLIYTLEELSPLQGTDIVSLVEAKAQLRVDHNDQDVLITGLIKSAVSMLDGSSGLCGYPISEQRFKYTFDGVTGVTCEGLLLPKKPIISLIEIDYYSTLNTLVSVNLDDWEVINNSKYSIIRPKNLIWPSVYSKWNAMSITWTAGRSNIPEVKQAALLLIDALYEQANGGSFEIPKAVHSLVNLKRQGWIG